MFGNNDDQQTTVGAPTTQNPSMLDNVSAQDFTGSDGSANQTAVATPTQSPPAPVQNTQPEHPITTDNPFAQTPANPVSTNSIDTPTEPADTPENVENAQPQITDDAVANANSDQKPAVISTHSSPSIQPSGPVSPPTIVPPTSDVGDATEDTAVPEVDTNKLAGMKQQALEHLEPLVEHLDQSPEEEFKTTMMMIQANDNHTLLDKALDAAKRISNDKERAQAMLDIINEINYFSQA